jgi:phenylpyruvate tautomerase PptA (4-oxalocrotonate tautomerase family)
VLTVAFVTTTADNNNMQAEDIQRIRHDEQLQQQQLQHEQQRQLIAQVTRLMRQVTVDENPRVCGTLREVARVLRGHLAR